MSVKEENAKAPLSRTEICEKIERYEREGLFHLDVEDDPPTKVLNPEDIDYLKRGFKKEIKRFFAYRLAHRFLRIAKRKKQIVFNPPEGMENLRGALGGAIITCNHFNAFDSFIMQEIFDKSKRKKRMYRIIREGNYTTFGGFFGILMRNCDTLPLSSNNRTRVKLFHAIGKLLADGNSILIYPEKTMWYNYKKPKPLYPGAFDIAVRHNVPVIPIFITLGDSDMLDADGQPVKIYTPHIGKPIYPDMTLGKCEASEQLLRSTFEYNKSVYERVYEIPLSYTTTPSYGPVGPRAKDDTL